MTSIFFHKPDNEVKQSSPSNANTSIFFHKPLNVPQEEGLPPDSSKSFTQSIAQDLGESEKMERDIERAGARTLSRIGERVLGTPGDIASFLPDFLGLGGLPTSGEIQEGSEKLTKGYTKPETEFEKTVDEYVGDVGSFALSPTGKLNPVLKAFGLPLAGALAKEGIASKGGTEGQQILGKVGTMVILDLLSQRRLPFTGGTNKYINSLFNDAEKAIPQGAKTNASNLMSSLNDLESSLEMGGTAPSKSDALKKILEIKNKIKNNEIDVQELPAFRRSINELISSAGGFEFKTPPTVKKQIKTNLNRVKKSVIEAGEEYGATHNPLFKEKWSQANEAAAAFHQSNKFSSFIKKVFGDKIESTGAKLLFGLGTAAAGKTLHHFLPAAFGASTLVGGASAGAYQAFKVFQRVKNSPTLRRYYTNVLTDAAKENGPGVASNLKKLDAVLSQEEKKEKELIEKYSK